MLRCSVVVLMVCLGSSAAYSIPALCQAFVCPEDLVCVVVEAAMDNCTENCSELEARCEPISSKIGECPENSISGAVSCDSLLESRVCLTDRDCSRDLKCCAGCCRAPDSLDIQAEQLDKPGNCPKAPYQERNIPLEVENLIRRLVCPEDRSVNQCLRDVQCPGIDKCCPDACGLICKKAFSIVSIEKRLRQKKPETTTKAIPDDLKKIPKPRRQLRPVIEPRRRLSVQSLPRPIIRA